MLRHIAVIALLLPSLAHGGELVGLWQEYDDQTGKVEALIRIEKTADNTYEGKIEKLDGRRAGRKNPGLRRLRGKLAQPTAAGACAYCTA